MNPVVNDGTQTVPKVFPTLHQRRVVVVSPKRVGPMLALVVSPGKLARDIPHKPAHLQPLRRIHQQVRMI